MAEPIYFLDQLSPTVSVGANTLLSVAQQTLAAQPTAFLTVGNADEFQAVISAEQLADAAGSRDLALSDLFSPLAPVITLAAALDSLSLEQVETLSEVLEATSNPGVLVYQGEEIVGVLAAETLTARLATGVTRISRSGQLDGTSKIGFRIYICETCGLRRIPATGEPLRCQRDPSHGQMVLEKLL